MTQISGAQIIKKELAAVLRSHPALNSAEFADLDAIYSAVKGSLIGQSHKPISKQIPILFELLITLDRHAKNDTRWTISSVDLLG